MGTVMAADDIATPLDDERDGSVVPDASTAANEHTFHQLLVNTLVSGVTSSFLWFALTFWVYLETRSVVATGVIGGAFSLSAAFLGPAFGTFVDHHRKHLAMVVDDDRVGDVLRRRDASCSSRSTPTRCCGCAARGSGCSSRSR